MKLSQHTETIAERVACVKPGRTLLLKLCIAVVALIGIVAVPAAVWADMVGYNLNKTPLAPRLALAAVLVLAGMGVFQSVQETPVRLQLDFFRDRLVLTYDALPSLWREGTVRQVTEIPYQSVTGCILSSRRMRLTLRCAGYTRTRGEDKPQQKTGTVSFSTLEARDVDFAALLEKYGSVKVQYKD